MVKGKIATFAFGGLAGYLIISKLINSTERCVQKVCEAKKWSSYYKHGIESAVPPGYYVHNKTTNGETTEEYDIDSIDGNASESHENTPVSASIKNAIYDTLGKRVKEFAASKGQTEASEDDICHHNCEECENKEKCPFEDVRKGGIITGWAPDSDGNLIPVSGRFPWPDNDDKVCAWGIASNHALDEEESDVDDTGIDSNDISFDFGENVNEKENNDETVD